MHLTGSAGFRNGIRPNGVRNTGSDVRDNEICTKPKKAHQEKDDHQHRPVQWGLTLPLKSMTADARQGSSSKSAHVSISESLSPQGAVRTRSPNRQLYVALASAIAAIALLALRAEAGRV